MAAGTTSLVAVLRDARKSALLWTRLMNGVELIEPRERSTGRHPSAPLSAGQLEKQADLLGGEWLGDILEGNRVLDDALEVRYSV